MLSEIWSIVLQQFAHTFKREEFLKNFINYILVEKSAYKGWKLYENDCETKKNSITCYKKLIKHSHLPEDNPGIDIYIDEEFEYECGKWCLSGYFSDEIVMYRCEDCM
jgi:hypothetical protein